jgi:hypothetical protein
MAEDATLSRRGMMIPRSCVTYVHTKSSDQRPYQWPSSQACLEGGPPPVVEPSGRIGAGMVHNADTIWKWN